MDEKESRHHVRRKREAKDTKYPKKYTKQSSGRVREDSFALTHNVQKHKEKESDNLSENSKFSTDRRLTIKSRYHARGNSSGLEIKELEYRKDTEAQIQANLIKILQLANDPTVPIETMSKKIRKPSKIIHRSFEGNLPEQTDNSENSSLDKFCSKESDKENQKFQTKNSKIKKDKFTKKLLSTSSIKKYIETQHHNSPDASVKLTACKNTNENNEDTKKRKKVAGSSILEKSMSEKTNEKNIPYDDWAKSIKKVLKDSSFVIRKGTEHFSEVIEDLQARHEEWCKVMTPPSVRTGISKIVMAMEKDFEINQDQNEIELRNNEEKGALCMYDDLMAESSKSEKDIQVLASEKNYAKSISQFSRTLPSGQFSNCPGTTISNPLSYLRRYEEKIQKPLELKKDEVFFQNVLNIIQSPSKTNFTHLLSEKENNQLAVKSQDHEINENSTKDKTPPILRTKRRSRCPKTIVLNPLHYLHKYESTDESTLEDLTSKSHQTNTDNLKPLLNLSSNLDQRSNLLHSIEPMNEPNQNEYTIRRRSPLLSNQTLLPWKSIKSPSCQKSNQLVKFSNEASLPISSNGFNVDYNSEFRQNPLLNKFEMRYQNQQSKDFVLKYGISEQTLRDGCNTLPIQNIIETNNNFNELYPASNYFQGAEHSFPTNISSTLEGGSTSGNEFEIHHPGTALCLKNMPYIPHNNHNHFPYPTQSLPSTASTYPRSFPSLSTTSDNMINNELYRISYQPEEKNNKKNVYYTACTPEISGAKTLKFGELILHQRCKSDTSSGTMSLQSSQENICYENTEMSNPGHIQQTLNFAPIERGIFGDQNPQQSTILNNEIYNPQYSSVLEQNVKSQNLNQPYPEFQMNILNSNELQNCSMQSDVYDNSNLYNPQNRIMKQNSQAGTSQQYQNPLHHQYSMQNINDSSLQHIHFMHPYQKLSHPIDHLLQDSNLRSWQPQ